MLLGIIGDTVLEGVNYIFLIIDSFIYGTVNKVYNVYMTLAGARIFSSDLFTAVANRIYALIGVVMLFVLAYSIIQGIISPDKMSKGAGSGSEIIKRVLKAVIGLAIVPAVFNLAYRGQDIILKNDVIGKIFLGFDNEGNMINHGSIKIDGEEIVSPGKINQNEGIKSQAGTITAVSIWQAFFYPTDTEDKTIASTIEAKEAPLFVKGASLLTKFGCGIAVASVIFSGPIGILGAATLCGGAMVADSAKNILSKVTTLEQAYGAAAGSGNFGYFPAFAKNVVEGDIQYVLLLSTIAGIVCIYLFLSFAIDMAVRAAKLAFLELIAPVPLMMQIMPNSQESYTKWYKNCLSLFFEVFIRLAMVYVIVYLIAHLGTVLKAITSTNIKDDFIANIVLKIILIFGLLIFAKEAPKFITDALGIKADLSGGIGIRNKLDKGGVFAFGAAAGAIGANVFSGTARGLSDATSGVWKKNNGLSFRQKAGLTAARLVEMPFKGVGQGIRASRRAIFESRGAHAPHDAREMMNIIKDNNASTRAQMATSRDKREAVIKDIRDRTDIEEGDNLLEKIVKGAGAVRSYTTDQIGEKIHNFAGIPKDTSYYTEQLKNAMSLTGLSKELDATVDSNDKVKDAKFLIEKMKSDQTTDALVRAKAVGGKTVEDVLQDQNAMKEVYAQQSKMIHEAEAAEKVARAQAIQENLAAAAAGEPGNATSIKLAEILDSNRDQFIKHRRDKTEDGRTLEDTLKSLFGDDVLSGKIDYGKAASRGASNLDISVDGVGRDGKQISSTISLRNKSNNGKIETKYYIRDENGKEQSFDSMDSALGALGIEKTSKISSRALGKSTTREQMTEDIKKALAGKTIELSDKSTIKLGADGKLYGKDGTEITEELQAYIGDRKVSLTEDYIIALQQVAGSGNDIEIRFDDGGIKKVIKFNPVDSNYVIINADGTSTSFDSLKDLKDSKALENAIVESSTTFTGDKESLVSELKTTGTQNQNFILSSPDYQEAMKNKPTNTGGGKK